jgi:hypothetical protein
MIGPGTLPTRAPKDERPACRVGAAPALPVDAAITAQIIAADPVPAPFRGAKMTRWHG